MRTNRNNRKSAACQPSSARKVVKAGRAEKVEGEVQSRSGERLLKCWKNKHKVIVSSDYI